MTHSSGSLQASLVSRLCGHGHATPSITTVATHHGFAGFFSQLNTVAQSLLDQLLLSEDAAPTSLNVIYDAQISGYGGGPLSQFFEPAFSCEPLEPRVAAQPLKSFPRYFLVSHLLRLIFKPRNSMARGRPQREHVEVAIHARRTDKLVARGAERIAIPNEEQLVALAVGCIRDLRAKRHAEHSHASALLPPTMPRLASTPVAPAVAHTRLPPSLTAMLNRSIRVLVASDDAAFAISLAARLRALRGLGQEPIEVSIESSGSHAGGGVNWGGGGGGEATAISMMNHTSAATSPPTAREHASCDASCVPPLLATLEGFARAASLVLSTGSNMGSFLLASWPAHNGDQIPIFVDTDQRVAPADLGGITSGKPASDEHTNAATSTRLGERFFCQLELGSRAGLCDSTERWSASGCSSHCLATLRGEGCKDCLEMRGGRG